MDGTEQGAVREAARPSAGKGRLGRLSGLLASREVTWGALAGALVMNLVGYGLLSVLLLFFALLGLCARQWGLRALDRVEVSAAGGHSALFAGEEVTLRYQVTNDKLLPLTWLEVCQDLPVNGCMEPLDGFERYELEQFERSDDPRGAGALYRRRLVFLMGLQTVSWDTVWAARRRGIYQLGSVVLRSGDGFGLTQTEARSPLAAPPAFVVYPRRVAVDPSPFLRQLWNGQTGQQGHFEDVTVMKSVRPYQPGDSWKRIDWRLAARQQGLQVRQYETIQPRTVHFILDGASFLGLSPGNDELEEALSVLSSLLVELDGAGVRCGLSLPQTALSPNVDLSPDDRSLTLGDLLFQLAGFDGDTAQSVFPGALLASLQNTVGQMCLLTHSRARLSCPQLPGQLDAGRLLALPFDDSPAPPGGGGDPLGSCMVLPLSRLKGGARRG